MRKKRKIERKIAANIKEIKVLPGFYLWRNNVEIEIDFEQSIVNR